MFFVWQRQTGAFQLGKPSVLYYFAISLLSVGRGGKTNDGIGLAADR
jgi:hypothetical protein